MREWYVSLDERKQPEYETQQFRELSMTIAGSILLSRFLSTANTQNHHFQQNGLQPEILGDVFVHCPFDEICGYSWTVILHDTMQYKRIVHSQRWIG